MSILTLLITLPGSLVKSQRQLVRENLALRQQVTMLRQSVKRPRSTAADRVFCGRRDINKRKESTKQSTTLDANPPAPTLSTTSPVPPDYTIVLNLLTIFTPG